MKNKRSKNPNSKKADASTPQEQFEKFFEGGELNDLKARQITIFLENNSSEIGSEKKIDLNKEIDSEKQDHAKTPLQIAIKNNRLDLFNALVKYGADINWKDKDGDNLLHFAVVVLKTKNTKEVNFAQELIKTGKFDVNAVNNDGETALMLAADADKKVSYLKSLIDAGADINIENPDGKTAYDMALVQKHGAEILNLLKKLDPVKAENKKTEEKTISSTVVHKGTEELVNTFTQGFSLIGIQGRNESESEIVIDFTNKKPVVYDVNKSLRYWYDDNDIDKLAKALYFDNGNIISRSRIVTENELPENESFVYLPSFSIDNPDTDNFDLKKEIWSNIINNPVLNNSQFITFFTAQRINGNHWINIEVEIDKTENTANFKLYDPKEQVGELDEELFEELKSFFQERLGDHLSYNNSINISEHQVQNEKDGSSCGKIVVDRIGRRINGENLEAQLPHEENKILEIIDSHVEIYPELAGKIENQDNIVEVKLHKKGEFSEAEKEVAKELVGKISKLNLKPNIILAVLSEINQIDKDKEDSGQKLDLLEIVNKEEFINFKNLFFTEDESFQKDLNTQFISETLNRFVLQKEYKIISDKFSAQYKDMLPYDRAEFEEEFIFGHDIEDFVGYLQSTNTHFTTSYDNWERIAKGVIKEVLKIRQEQDNKLFNKAPESIISDYKAISLSGETYTAKEIINVLPELFNLAQKIDNTDLSKKFDENSFIPTADPKNIVTNVINFLKSSYEKTISNLKRDADYENLDGNGKRQFFETLNEDQDFLKWQIQAANEILTHIPQYLAAVIDFNGEKITTEKTKIIQNFGLEDFKGHSDNFMLLIGYVLADVNKNNYAATNISSHFTGNSELQKLFETKAESIKKAVEQGKIDLGDIVNYYFTEIEKSNIETLGSDLLYKAGKKEERIPHQNIITFENKHNNKEYKVAFLDDVIKEVGKNFDKWKEISESGFTTEKGGQGIKKIKGTKNLYELKPKGDLGNERCYAVLEENILVVIGHGSKDKQVQDIKKYGQLANKEEIKLEVNDGKKDPSSSPITSASNTSKINNNKTDGPHLP